jgi:hypothetical protein
MTMPSNDAYDALLRPSRLYTRNEVLARPCPVPARPGVYAWYFREVPPGVPVQGCRTHDGVPLLYVGISPSKPPTNGKLPSRESVAKRLRYHFAGNAAGSTLRLTLGCLLADKLGIMLTRVALAADTRSLIPVRSSWMLGWTKTRSCAGSNIRVRGS